MTRTTEGLLATVPLARRDKIVARATEMIAEVDGPAKATGPDREGGRNEAETKRRGSGLELESFGRRGEGARHLGPHEF